MKPSPVPTTSSTPANDLILSAPDLDWSYAVIERLNPVSLTTSLIPFNPGQLYLNGDQSQNLLLIAGDVVTFFSTADIKVPTSQQTRYVRLEGEFLASGEYSVLPGETLRHLLARVGGFTSDALPVWIGVHAQNQPSESSSSASTNTLTRSKPRSPCSLPIKTPALSVTATPRQPTHLRSTPREAVSRLRRVVPLGRIVLELKPRQPWHRQHSRPAARRRRPLRRAPAFPPPSPSRCQVYSANAFVFERGRKERDYLRQAGPDPTAKPTNGASSFCAPTAPYTADSTATSTTPTMFPGDTIVVPPQLDHRAFLRNLVDIATVVSGFGLGAAAIEVLK